MKTKNLINLYVALLIVFAGIVLRLVPHAPNFTPIAAVALFAGAYLPKKMAFVLPILAMAVSDFFIGFYEPELMISVYGSFLLCVVIGLWLKESRRWYAAGGGALLSAALFFVITNFAVWAFTPWYAKTFHGIIQCYFMALPFFRNTLLGDLFYVSVFFGVYKLAKSLVKKRFENKQSLTLFDPY